MLYNFFANFLEPIAYLVYFIAFLLEIRKHKAINTWILLIHYLFATILMVYAAMKALLNQNNVWLYNLVCLQSSVAICFYFHQLVVGRKQKLIVKFILAANVIYFLVTNVILGRFFLFDSIGYAILSVSVSILGFFYFYDVLKNVRIRQYDFNFYLVSGYLIYFLVSFAIFLTYHYLTNRILDTYTDEERGLLTILWGVHNVSLFLSAMTTLSGSLWIIYRNR